MDIRSSKIDRTKLGDGQIRMMHLDQKDREPHVHTIFELVYILKGTATHYLDQAATTLQAGDYFIIDPGTTHAYYDTQDLELVNCLFLPAYIDRALDDCPSLASLLSNKIMRFGVPMDIHAADRILHDSDKSVGKLIRKMEQEYADGRVGNMELLRCYLTQILVYAVRATEERSQPKAQHDITAQIVTYMQKNYAKPLSLESISKRFGYTPQYLSSLFHKQAGMTLQAFLQRLRVEEACRLMEQKNMPLTTLAQAVGYADAKHFSKVFRRHKGMSPREYRASQL